MSIAVNGQSQVPPGFRFHPTEEELLDYYLRKKVANERIELDVIQEVDLNRMEPWDIQDKCRIGTGRQCDWYLFSHKDRKYPTGTRTNRATAAGFWKATGRDKVIRGPGRDGRGRRLGMRKTLVFYTGRAPHGCKSDWIMHEYRLDDDEEEGGGGTEDRGAKGRRRQRPADCVCGDEDDSKEDDGWVVCRLFKKKNFVQQTSPKSATQSPSACGSVSKEELVKYKRAHFADHDEGQLCKIERSGISDADKAAAALLDGFGPVIADVPALESPVSDDGQIVQPTSCSNHTGSAGQGWVVVDRLIASHLDGQQGLPTFLEGERYPEQGYGVYKAEEVGYPDACGHGGADPDIWLLLQSSIWSLT